jgi:polysaccharide export outer membrane protein
MTCFRPTVVLLFLVITFSSSVAIAQTRADGRKLSSPATSPASLEADSTRVRVGPGDLLEVKVFDISELDQQVRVSDRGDAVLTFLGRLHLAGLTTAEVQTLVENRLREGNFVREPQVSILIDEYGTQGVSILGEVAKPGVYPVLGPRTLLDMISLASGLTPMAAHEATIKRREGAEVFTASLSDNPAELLASNIELWPGDTVIVPKAGIVYVIGDVGKPGGFVMENSGRESLLEAVALAAGVNRTAALSKTRVIRKTSAGYEDIPVDLKRILNGKTADIALQREDIVYIPPSMARSMLFHTPQMLEAAASSAMVYTVVP